MFFLKQSTAATIALGPFVDNTDGFTAETGLTISQADVRLSKNGAAFAQKNDSTSASHMENGWYSVPLNTTDSDTLGRLRIAVNEAGALPVWMDVMVCPANVWDALFGSDKLQVDLVSIDDQTTAGNNATLNLKQLNIVNSAGSALIASSTGSNGHGIAASGNGSGEGISATGGATGNGAEFLGGATSGNGIHTRGVGSGHGIECEGEGNSKAGLAAHGDGSGGPGIYAFSASGGEGMWLNGDGAAPGLLASGGATGHGLYARGGGTSGSGIRANTTGGAGHGIHASGTTNSHGMFLEGAGSGEGLNAVGGATGHGIQGTGGATSGAGISAVGGPIGSGIEAIGGATAGSGIDAAATSSTGHGGSFTGNGSGEGLKAIGGATGNGAEFVGGATSGDALKLTVTSGVKMASADFTGSVATDGSNSATSFKTDLTQSADDHWNGALIRLTSGSLAGQVRKISDYDGTTKFVTVLTAFTGTPADGVTFDIVNE